MNLRKNAKTLAFVALAVMATNACKQKEKSSTTGWKYNDEKNGGFEVTPYTEQETGPGLILVEGGTFAMGRTEQEIPYDWDNIPRRVTVSSFYMDETEIANVHYLEYLYWLDRVYGTDYPEVYKKALPDTLVWRSKLGYNEPMVELYLRHPAYQRYPVVGVNWLQANDFASWRTDRVNEQILVREGILRVNPAQVNEDNFNTDAYLAGQYEGLVKSKLQDLNPNRDERNVRMEDGILLPRYELPTEAEWEYAARGGTETPYFFDGNPKKYTSEGFFKKIFKPDTSVIASRIIYKVNSNSRTSEPSSVKPNPFGLRNMLGNVAEFCSDIYSENYYMHDSTRVNPKGPLSGQERVIRGGSFKSDAKDVRSASRDYTKSRAWLVTDPQMPKSIWWYSDCIDVGFRVVCEPDSAVINENKIK